MATILDSKPYRTTDTFSNFNECSISGEYPSPQGADMGDENAWLPLQVDSVNSTSHWLPVTAATLRATGHEEV